MAPIVSHAVGASLRAKFYPVLCLIRFVVAEPLLPSTCFENSYAIVSFATRSAISFCNHLHNVFHHSLNRFFHNTVLIQTGWLG